MIVPTKEFEGFFFFHFRDVYNEIPLWDKESNNVEVNHIYFWSLPY